MLKDSDTWECEYILELHHWGIRNIPACLPLLQSGGKDGAYFSALLLSSKGIMHAKYLARKLGEHRCTAASSSPHPPHCARFPTGCPPPPHLHTWLLRGRKPHYRACCQHSFLLGYSFLAMASVPPPHPPSCPAL